MDGPVILHASARPACRLLALDVDGTLLRSDKTVSPRTRAAVAAAREAGVHLTLVTGRRYPSARAVAETLGGAVPLVLHNGALIIDFNAACRDPALDAAGLSAAPSLRRPLENRLAGSESRLGGTEASASGAPAEDGAVLRCRPLPRTVALEAVRIGRRYGADPVVHCGHHGEGRLLVQSGPTAGTLVAYYLAKSHPDVVAYLNLEEELREDPLQVMFGGPLAEMAALLPELQRGLGAGVKIERTVYPAQGVGLLDVLEPSVGKADALVFLQERWGLSARETVAIGDNWNDHEMLERAGLGLVMGNADPEMLALGLPVLPTNDEDGVAVAIETYVLYGGR